MNKSLCVDIMTEEIYFGGLSELLTGVKKCNPGDQILSLFVKSNHIYYKLLQWFSTSAPWTTNAPVVIF